ncbi:hypothetical protein SAY86_029431 [Trapa natans]|uniref:Auxin efflux carrier component n=1 Tax=Trapa natans TaxID=22666 RepID=A0AAN7RD05_TRANT|nr:hypothetical protein SAY86_029431 [Trapa natans]
MIGGKDIYEVISALAPLYVAMFLAYGSVRWWGIFTAVQCSGINRFVAIFAVPFLGFKFISSLNLYSINYKFIAADTLQKVAILLLLAVWSALVSVNKTASRVLGGGGRLGPEWSITFFALSTLPNTLIVGIPLLEAMYGSYAADLMVQIIVFQGAIWYNVLLFLFEYRAAKALVNERFPGSTREIASIKVDSDVVSLAGAEPLETDSERDADGRLRVRVRRSSFGSSSFNNNSFRLSNLSGVEIYSVQSSPDRSVPSIRYTGREPVSGIPVNPVFFKTDGEGLAWMGPEGHPTFNGPIRVSGNSRTGGAPVVNPDDHHLETSCSKGRGRSYLADEKGGAGGRSTRVSSRKVIDEEAQVEEQQQQPQRDEQESPAAAVMLKLILLMVWRKLIRNPNTYASLLGVIWSLISNRYHVKMPGIISGSISILSSTGLGMAVFSLGLFTALQPRLITCTKMAAGVSMAARFLVGPAVMAATSLAIGIRGQLLHVGIVQAALPLGLVPFVFAKEYDLHADIISTSVIFGMLIALPVTILYNVLLEL